MTKMQFSQFFILIFACHALLGGTEAQRRRSTTTTATARPVRARPCPPIPNVPNGSGLNTGNTVNFVCLPGFVLQGTNVITCVNGRWTVEPRCVRQLCSVPPSTPFGTFSLSQSGVVATYTCQAGFQLSGAASTQCNTVTRSWPDPPVCQQVISASCGAPPTVLNGQSVMNANGQTVNYICNSGYNLIGPSTLVCSNFQWPSPPSCQANAVQPPAATCGRPPCGGITIEPSPTADVSQIGVSVLYNCVPGYRVVGSQNNVVTASIKCLPSGQWEIPPLCEPKQCGTPPAGTNTNLIVSAVYSVGDRYIYSCLPGYVLSTGLQLERVCQIDGTWSGLTPVCQPVSCSASTIKIPANAFNTNPLASYLVGATVQLLCNFNYITQPQPSPAPAAPENIQVVTCQSDGTFTASTKTCVYQYPKSCAEYFSRLGQTGTVADVSTSIDPDGAGSATVQFPVLCSRTPSSVLTKVPASYSAASLSSGAVALCTITTPPSDLTTFVSTLTSAQLCSSSFAPVTYNLPAASLSYLISASAGGCSQLVTWNCNSGATSLSDENDALFIAIKNNGVPSSRVYNSFQTEITQSAANFFSTPGLSWNGECDCRLTGCPRCACAGRLVANSGLTDTIKIPLTASRPEYVLGVLLGRNGVATATTASSTVTVGEIQCSENV